MSHVLRVGIANQLTYFWAYNTDDSPKTDLVAATPGLTLEVFRAQLAPISITPITDKASDNAVHSDGAIRQVSGGLYSIDLPDTASAVQCESIGIRGSFTGGRIEPWLQPIVGYNPSLPALGGLTSTSIAALDDITGVGFGCPVERSPDDTNPITFSFEGPSLTLTGTRSINNGTYAAVDGAITYLRTDGGVDFYTLAYNANDRPSSEGTVTYRFVETGWISGDPERFVTLRIAVSGGGEADWTLGEREQLRHRLGIDGTKATPATSNPNLGDVTMTQLAINSSGTIGKVPLKLTSNASTNLVEMLDSSEAITYGFTSVGALSADIDGGMSGNVAGNIDGKVLGGGVGTITGTGVQAQLPDDAITSAKIQDGAFTAAKFAAGAFDAVWSVAARTLTSISDSAGITTLLTRITGLLRTKAEDEVVDATVLTAIDNISTELTEPEITALAAAIAANLNAGDATAVNQQLIIDALRRTTKMQY